MRKILGVSWNQFLTIFNWTTDCRYVIHYQSFIFHIEVSVPKRRGSWCFVDEREEKDAESGRETKKI